jgi:hypothetical protein
MRKALMKLLDYLVLALLFLMFLFAASSCSPIIDENAEVVCIEIYDPVCVKGNEFSNACYAEAAGYSNSEIIKGKCYG